MLTYAPPPILMRPEVPAKTPKLVLLATNSPKSARGTNKSPCPPWLLAATPPLTFCVPASNRPCCPDLRK